MANHLRQSRRPCNIEALIDELLSNSELKFEDSLRSSGSLSAHCLTLRKDIQSLDYKAWYKCAHLPKVVWVKARQQASK